MDVIPQLIPEDLLVQQTTIVRIVISFCSVIFATLGYVCRLLWFTLQEKNKYIIEESKSNFNLLSDFANSYKTIGLNVEKIEAALKEMSKLTASTEDYRRKLEEVRNELRTLNTKK